MSTSSRSLLLRRSRACRTAVLAAAACLSLLALGFKGASAQTTGAPAQASNNQVPANVMAPPDRQGMETRLAACAMCHGKQGEGDLDRRGGVYPRLAGQPAGYLYEQMTQFVSGERTGIPPVVLMRKLLENLTPAYLHRIAEFYQDATPPYPPPLPESSATLQAGRNIVERGLPTEDVPACVACHGASLEGRLPATPALAGQNDRYLTVQFMHWKLDQRLDPLHQKIAGKLTETQVQEVSAYLSTLRPTPAGASR